MGDYADMAIDNEIASEFYYFEDEYGDPYDSYPSRRRRRRGHRASAASAGEFAEFVEKQT